MATFSVFSRVAAVALSGALVMTSFQPVSAAPLPVSRDLGATAPVEVVQYRRAYRPAYAPVRKKRRGDAGAAAALAIGALAIGAAAIAASNSRRERVYYEDPYYGQGYAPAPVYSGPRYYSAPQYYDPAPQYYAPAAPRHTFGRRAPQIDGGSPYAVEQQRVQRRAAVRQWQRQQAVQQGYVPQSTYNPYLQPWQQPSNGLRRDF